MTATTAGFTLDTLARKKLEKLRRQEKDARLHNRFSALLWLGQGHAPEEVAAPLGVGPRTVRHWRQLYQRGGLEAQAGAGRAGGSPGGGARPGPSWAGPATPAGPGR